MAEAAQVRDLDLSTPSLVKLVKLDHAAGWKKGMEDFARAGARLLELKRRCDAEKKAWAPWFKKQHFEFSMETARRHMIVAEQRPGLKGTRHAGEAPRTLSQATGDHRPHHQPTWTDSDAAREARERYAAEREQRAQASAYYTSASQRDVRRAEHHGLKERAEEIINLGYRLAAAKYHPDKQGGSHAEMMRTTKARDRLRSALRML